MMASPSELTLECKPQSYSMLLKSFADHQNPASLDLQATQRLEDYIHRLEEERVKIDAFKRELPLCMQLLTNAMETSRQQLQTYKETHHQGGTISSSRPVLEEFIPLKTTSSSNPDTDQKPALVSSDKASWMTSAQLWSDGNKHYQQQQQHVPKTEAEMALINDVSPSNKPQIRNGAFLPFTKERNALVSSPTGNDSNMRASTVPELALAAGSSEREREEKKSGEIKENSLMSEGGGKVLDSQTAATGTATGNQTHRKARRCWSPDLHRRFVNALQMLGGSQVATPKQIRELMKVDGLTNDEVKSHLQKYRLHTRRPSPSPQAAGAPTPQLVVLGGIWVPPEYAAAAHHGGAPAAIYSAHSTSQVSPHYISPPPAVVPTQDFYAPPPLPPSPQAAAAHIKLLHHAGHQQLHQHHHQHPQQQLHVYKTSSHTQTHSSPESDARGAGERSESMEDGGKSESSSWKGDSGGEGNNNRGERNGLTALRDEGEESNGSHEITLKF